MKNNYNQNSMKNINSENINIEKILIKQIGLGNDEDYGAFYEYNEEDLSALVSIEDTMLKNNGYKILTEDKFSQKIKNIFGRIIDYNSSTKFLKIETFEGAKCDFKLEYYPYGADAQYIYVDKTNKFITNFFPLPRILDYVKLYPQVMKYEEKDLIIDDKIEDIQVKASQWKDEENLSQQRHFNHQLLINRNKYLFNDSKASLTWLKVNDSLFLESLVTTFGYTKDKDLLDWVMQRNRSKAVEFINNYVFVRNCKGELEIREDILKYIEQVYCKDFLFVQSYTTFKIDNTGNIILSKYGENYTDRGNPDKDIPSKIKTYKDFGKVYFSEVNQELLHSLIK